MEVPECTTYETTYGSNPVKFCAIRDLNNLQNKKDSALALTDLNNHTFLKAIKKTTFEREQ